VKDADLEQGLLFPPAARIREVALAVAIAVANAAYDRGLATTPRPADTGCRGRWCDVYPTVCVSDVSRQRRGPG
jgi:hypothetical protein